MTACCHSPLMCILRSLWTTPTQRKESSACVVGSSSSDIANLSEFTAARYLLECMTRSSSPEFIENVLEIYNHAAVTQRRPLRKLAASAAAAYADQPAAAPLLAEADKSLREVTAVHINIDPTEASELGEMIANSLRDGSSMLRGGA